ITVSLFLWGAVSDRVGRERAYAAGTACLLLALLLLFGLKREPSLSLVYAFILLAGLGLGSRPGLLNAMVADLFAGEHIAAINGAALSGLAVGGSMGAWSGGYIFDLTGSYDLALLIAAVTSGLASLFAFLALPGRLRLTAGGAVRGEGS
ncbi:MAG: MFS transporter, partial [Nitrospinota bacterium]